MTYYALTARDGLRLFDAAKAYSVYSSAVLQGAPILQRVQLLAGFKTTLGYMRAAPASVRAVGSTMKALVGYARARNIEVSADSQEAMSALGSIDESALKESAK